jgi:hypothetical protein
VPAISTADGVRAVNKNKPVEPEAAERYLKSKFGDGLGAAQKAMRDLAKAFKPEQLAENSFRMYEMFRPSVPEGVPRWGAMGELDLDYIRSLVSKSK